MYKKVFDSENSNFDYIVVGYRLVIVCSKEGEDKSHIVSKLLLHKRSIVLKHDDKCQSYLRGHFIQAGGSTQAMNASIVDLEKWVKFINL
jgi:hypothetical protein